MYRVLVFLWIRPIAVSIFEIDPKIFDGFAFQFAPDALVHTVTGGTGRVGVRVPAQAAAQALCRACATPLTATSANLSDRHATSDPDEVVRTLGSRIELLLDDGKTAGGAPSTIVDVTSDMPRLVRPGAVEWDRVLACVQHL